MKQVATLLIVCLLSLAANATGRVNFVKNMTWAQVKARAAKEKKMIFFDAYTSWCGPCKYLEQSVYTNALVAAFFNANFINVKFDMEVGEGLRLAEDLGITAYPTLLFFSPDGKPLHKFIGALEPTAFLNLGKDAVDPARQYFSLKEKVADRRASPEDFVKWSALADELEDHNRGTVASEWLTSQPDILGTAGLAKVTLLYSDLNESQLAYLYQQKNRIQLLLGWDLAKTEATLYRKLFDLAVKKVDDNTRDTKEFIAVISKYDISLLYFALTDLQLRWAIHNDRDIKKGIEILALSIRGNNRISLPQLCALLIDHTPRLEKAETEFLIRELNDYAFTAEDRGHEWGLYLAQLICYSKLDQNAKARELAGKAYRHPQLPESYKPVLKESYGLID